MSNQPEPLTLDRILGLSEVAAIVGLDPPQIYAAIVEGDFPPGVTVASGIVGWRAADIDDWLNTRRACSMEQISAVFGVAWPDIVLEDEL